MAFRAGRIGRELSTLIEPSSGAPGLLNVRSNRRVFIAPAGPVSVCSVIARTLTFTLGLRRDVDRDLGVDRGSRRGATASAS